MLRNEILKLVQINSKSRLFNSNSRLFNNKSNDETKEKDGILQWPLLKIKLLQIIGDICDEMTRHKCEVIGENRDEILNLNMIYGAIIFMARNYIADFYNSVSYLC